MIRILKSLPLFTMYEAYDLSHYLYFRQYNIFPGWGIHLYTGRFGAGKTQAMTYHAYCLCKKFPQLSILTNIPLKFFPTYTNILKLETAEDILNAPENCLVLIDEIGTIFNSRDFSGGKKAVPKPLFQHLCQCRKRKMQIYGTVQRFNLLDKQIRDITATVTDCTTFFRHPFSRITSVKRYDIDEYETYCENRLYIPHAEYKEIIVQTNQSRQLYDTTNLVQGMLKKDYLSDEEILTNRGDIQTDYDVLDKKGKKAFRNRKKI